MLQTLKLLVAAAAAVLLSAGAAYADTRVIGAGATFPKPLYLKWVSTYNTQHPGVQFDYTGGGSGAGIKALTDRTAQFAASDAPMTAAQIKALPAKALHLPTVAGPVAITFNLPGVTELTLDGDAIVGIYTGRIKSWDDAALAKLNPNAKLPAKAISVAHRSDPSGTSFIFTTYLSSVSPLWKQKVGAAIDVKWPKGDGGKGNDGVADLVKNVEGGIGYVELAYAQEKKLPCAAVINKAGNPVKPDIAGVNAAAENVKEIPESLIVNIDNAAGEKSYPIAGYTFLLVYQDLKDGNMDRNQAEALVKFLLWATTDGQEMAAPNYARLSKAMQEKVTAAIKGLKYDGQPLVK